MKTFAIFALALVIALTGCKKDPVVAEVGSKKIRSNDLKIEMLRRTRTIDNAVKQPVEMRFEALDNMIDRELKLMDAHEKKIEERPEVAKIFKQQLMRAGQQELYNVEVRDKIIKTSTAKDFWKHLDMEVKASHILIQSPESADASAKAMAKARIDSIYKAVTQPNADFAAIATATTQDMSSRDGDLGYFKWGTMVDEFQSVAWKLDPGKISKPFQTSYGWHIVKVVDRRKVDRKPFDEMKDEIMRTLSKVHRKELTERAQAFIKDLNNKYKVEEQRSNIAMIAAKLGPSNTIDVDPFATLTDADKNLPLITFKPGKENWGVITEKNYYKEGKFTIQALMDKFAEAGRPGPIPDSAALAGYGRDVVGEWLLNDYIMKNGYTKDKKVLDRAQRESEVHILSRLDAEVVGDRVNHPTDADLQNFMNENPARWMTQPQVDMVEVLFIDPKAAENFAAAAKKRGKITLAEAKRLTKRAAAKGKEGILEKVTPSMHDAIGATSANAKVGEIVGPVGVPPNWSVYQVTKRIEPHPLTLEAGRQQIEQSYRTEVGKRVRAEWMKGLREKWKVTVFEQPVKNLYVGVKVDESKPKSENSRLSDPKRMDQIHKDK